MQDFTTLERADIYIGNLKGLASVVLRQHTASEPTKDELFDAYNNTQDVASALVGYVQLLDASIQELMHAEMNNDTN
jgi:hypothetical protein